MRPLKLVIYPNDCQVIYSHNGLCDPPSSGKSEIEFFTKDSRRRLAFVAANTHIIFTVMITLTYPKQFPANGEIVKRHFKRFKDSLLRKFPCSYLWCIEFQRRGAPHYHVLIDSILPLDDKKWVSKRWYDVVGSGDAKHLQAGTRTEKLRSKRGGNRYIVKYAGKMRQKKVPDGYEKVGRFWGHSRDVKPEPVGEIELTTGYDALRMLLASWDRADCIKLPLKTLYNASRSVLDVTGQPDSNR
jgi:hypothetical protein